MVEPFAKLVAPVFSYFDGTQDHIVEQIPFYSIYAALVLLAINAVLNDSSFVLGEPNLSRLLRASPYICLVDSVWKLFSSIRAPPNTAAPLVQDKTDPALFNPPETDEPFWQRVLKRLIAIIALSQIIKFAFYRGVLLSQLAVAFYGLHSAMSYLTNPPIRPRDPARRRVWRLDATICHLALVASACLPYLVREHSLKDKLKTCLPGIGLIGMTILGRGAGARNNIAMQTIELLTYVVGYSLTFYFTWDDSVIDLLQSHRTAMPLITLFSVSAAVVNIHLLGGAAELLPSIIHCVALAVVGLMIRDVNFTSTTRPLWTRILI